MIRALALVVLIVGCSTTESGGLGDGGGEPSSSLVGARSPGSTFLPGPELDAGQGDAGPELGGADAGRGPELDAGQGDASPDASGADACQPIPGQCCPCGVVACRQHPSC